jgi:hypothetical protein
VQWSVGVVSTGEVAHQPAVADGQHIGGDAILDPGQQPAHGRAVADPDIGQLRRVHVGAGDQQVHGPARVHDQLDLFVAVLGGEADVAPDGALLGAVEGRVDQDGHGPVRARWIPTGRKSSLVDGRPCWTMTPGNGPLPLGTTSSAGTSPPLGLA